MTRKWFLALLTLMVTTKCAQASPQFQLSLNEAQDAALATSEILKSQSSLVNAAHTQTEALTDLKLPRVSLLGNYFYQTHVASKTLGSLGTLSFGDHNNYTLGAQVDYTLLDGGQMLANTASAAKQTNAKTHELSAQQRFVIFQTRLAYFKVQLALKNMLLTANALKLAQAQNQDISLRYKTGTASRLDQVSSHRDALGYQLKFMQAQSETSAALRELLALSGETQSFDTSKVVPAELELASDTGANTVSLIAKLDTQEQSLHSLPAATASPDFNQDPQLLALADYATAAELAASSATAADDPKVLLSGKTLMQYPDSVIPQTAFNTIVMASFSWPLQNWQANERQATQQQLQAAALRHQRNDKLTTLKRDYARAFDIYQNLNAQRDLLKLSQSEAQDIAQLTYQAYQAGRATYLEVQSSNLRLLEAKIEAARNSAETLRCLATLASLAPDSDQRSN